MSNKKDKGIKLSQEHGLNPSVVECFWCGKELGVAMLGKLPKDVKAPKRIVADYEPCEECRSKFEQGILVFEVTTTPNCPNQPPIGRDAEDETHIYPTGQAVVMRSEAFHEGAPDKMAASPEQFQELLQSAGNLKELKEAEINDRQANNLKKLN